MNMKINIFLSGFFLFFIFLIILPFPVLATRETRKCFKWHNKTVCIPIKHKPKPSPKPTKHPQPSTTPSITRFPTSTLTPSPTIFYSPTPTITISPTPYSFSDNFDDNNADGWWLGYSHHTPWINGNWRVENGILVQDQAGDDFIALVENIQSSDQTIETQLKLNGPAGYGGVTFWYEDNSRVTIIMYPAAGTNGLYITEVSDGVSKSVSFPYQYLENTWYNLKVNANSASGELKVYIDNTYLFSYTVSTTTRIGQSGINNGNSGGYFDDFILDSRVY